MMVGFAKLCVIGTMMVVGWVASSCRTLSDTDAIHTSSLQGVQDARFTLRLVPADYPGSPYLPGIYTFQVCKRDGDQNSVHNCTMAFLNAAKDPVPVRIDLLPQQDLTPAELAYVKSVNTDYQRYVSALRATEMRQATRKKDAVVDREILITSSVGGGAYVFGKSLQVDRIALHGANLRELRKDLELKEELLDAMVRDSRTAQDKIKHLLNHVDGTPEQVAKSLIDNELTAGKGVFDDDLIKWLDAEGLPAPVRNWLSHNKLSIGHYLLDPKNFMKHIAAEPFLPADQLTAFHKIVPEFPIQYLLEQYLPQHAQQPGRMIWNSHATLQAHVFDETVASAMRQYLIQQYGKIDGMLLFKSGIRERVVESILAHNNVGSPKHLSVIQQANPYSKHVMINYYLGLDDPHNIGRVAFVERWEDSFRIRAGFGKGISHQRQAFHSVSPHHGYTNLSNIGKFRYATDLVNRQKAKIKLLENNILELTSFRGQPTIRLGEKLGDMAGLPQRPRFVNGILGFMSKRHRVGAVIAGTIAAAIVTFSSRKLAEAAGQSAAEAKLATDGVDLILDGSSLLWETEHEGSADFEAVRSVESVMANIVRFQHNVWMGDTDDTGNMNNEDELAEVRIAYQCMPISSQIHCVEFDEI